MDRDLYRKRLLIVMGLFILVALFIATKLFFVQIIHTDRFRDKAEVQYTTPEKTVFDRGTIYFQKRDTTLVSAAMVQSGFKIAFNPSKLPDAETAYDSLSPLFELDRDEFMKKAAKKSDPYEEIAERIPKSVVDQILALKIPGVQAVRQNWRFYPAGTLASHVIGFMSYKGDELDGRYGLEKFYDDRLARTQSDLYVNFFAEVFSELKSVLSPEAQQEGDLVTTIEPSVQVFLEQELTKTKEKWNSDRAAGLIMNPKTGEIYSFGVYPSYDNNNFSQVSSNNVYANPLVESVFEVGSIMKPIIMAIALEAGVLTPQTTYMDNGSVKVGTKIISNFDKKARGRVSMQEVLNQSLNTGMVYVQQHTPKDVFHDKLRAFGFGQKTGIDLPGELSGLTSNLETKRDVEYANISFGQGIAVTPIAMARALAALGNGGYLVHPHIVSRIDLLSGGAEEFTLNDEKTQILRPEISEEITRMLVTVFDSYFEGKYKFEHYTVAAKTGTAQIARPEGGYYEDRNLHSFFGYFPAYDPQFIVYLYNEYPKNGAQYASQTLIEPFTNITKVLLSYYDVPPDR